MKKILTILVITVLISSVAYATEDINSLGLEKIGEVYNLIMNNYYGNITKEELSKSAIKGMVAYLDNYSRYISKPNSMIDYNYDGLGIRISYERGMFVIDNVIPNYPAHKLGIKEGDQIIRINGLNLVDFTLSELVKLIKSSIDKVNLTVLREKQMVFSIPKSMISEKKIGISVAKEVTKDTQYIKIDSFTQGVSIKFRDILRISKIRGRKNIILDLRGNSGGIFEEAIFIAKQIIPKGTIIYTKDNKGNEQKYSSSLKYSDFKFAVLVDNKTASCSEILATSIKESGIGVLIGTKTYGKGVVQTVLKDKYGNYLKLTTHEFYGETKKKINNKGLTPNIQYNYEQDYNILSEKILEICMKYFNKK